MQRKKKKERKRGDKRRKEGELSILQTGHDKRKRSNGAAIQDIRGK